MDRRRLSSVTTALRLLGAVGLLIATRVTGQSPAPPAWRLTPRPILTLGGPDGTGPTEFANVYTGTFWGRRLVLLDGATQTLRLFEIPSGRHIRTFGRKGQGPGEFQNVGHLQPLPGDSLFVSDLVTSRYSIFDSETRLVRDVSLAVTVAGTRVTPLGRLPDGTILAWAIRFMEASGPGLHLVRATIYRVTPDGTGADSIRSLPFAKVQEMSIGGGRGWRVPLGARQLFPAVTPEIALFTAPTDYTLYSYAAAAGSWKDIHETIPVRLSREADIQARRDAAVRDGASPQIMSQVMGIDTLPPLVFPLASSDGSVWVVESATDSASGTRRVSIYQSDGRVRARIRIPEGLHLGTGPGTIGAGTERRTGLSLSPAGLTSADLVPYDRKHDSRRNRCRYSGPAEQAGQAGAGSPEDRRRAAGGVRTDPAGPHRVSGASAPAGPSSLTGAGVRPRGPWSGHANRSPVPVPLPAAQSLG